MGQCCCRRSSGNPTASQKVVPAKAVPVQGELLPQEPDPESPASPAVVRCEGEVVSWRTATPEAPKTPLRKTQVKPEAAPEYRPEHHQAAVQMQKYFRGHHDRSYANDRFWNENSRGSAAIDPRALGLGPYAEMHHNMPKVPDHARYAVRDETIKAMWPQLGCPLEALPGRGWYSTFEENARFVLEKLAKEKTMLPEAVRRQMAAARLFVETAELPKAAPEVKPSNNKGTASTGSAGFLERRKDCYLLGQFDCLAVPAKADYDAWFKPLKQRNSTKQRPGQVAQPSPKIGAVPSTGTSPSTPTAAAAAADCDGPEGFAGWFWILHAAAPNIGESAQAEDFVAYSREEGEEQPAQGMGMQAEVATRPGTGGSGGGNARCCWKQNPLLRPCRRLDEDRYVGDMGRLWRNALVAAGRLGVEEAIFFPFGMGAFLRHLGQNDDRYVSEAAMQNLRRRVADELMAAIAELCLPSEGEQRLGPPLVHLCLVCIGEESIDNHNAFVRAAEARAKQCRLMDVLQLRQNVDCLQLANEQAGRCQGAGAGPKVAVLNGCNRKLVGNHWFQTGARMAIDENLHRRSASMARAALLLNYDFEPRPRKPGALRDSVIYLGGEIIRLSDGALVGGTSKAGLPPSNPKLRGREGNASEGEDPEDGPPQRSRCCGCGGGKRKKAKGMTVTPSDPSAGTSVTKKPAAAKAQSAQVSVAPAKQGVKQGWQ